MTTTPHPSETRFHTTVTRRVLGALAALALAGGLAAGPVVAAAAATRPGAVRTAPNAAEELVATLDDDALAELRDGIPNAPRSGLRLGDLTEAQRLAAYALLRSLLSSDAWRELVALREADAALGVADDYRIALFGDPSADYVLQFSTGEVLLSILRQGDTIDVSPDVVA